MDMKKKILGVPIFALVIGIVLLGGASALIVNYLSNTATATIEVNSPMTVNFANIDGPIDVNGVFDISGSWVPTLTTPSTTGLGTVYVGIKVNNNADIAIENKWLVLKVTNQDNNVGCSDLSSLSFMDTATPETIALGFQELSGLCTADPSGYVTYNIDINQLDAGQEYIYPSILVFGNVAPATYNFEATMINSLV